MLRAAWWCRERSVAGKEEANLAGMVLHHHLSHAKLDQKIQKLSFLSPRGCSQTILSGCTSLRPIGNLQDLHGLQADGREQNNEMTRH